MGLRRLSRPEGLTRDQRGVIRLFRGAACRHLRCIAETPRKARHMQKANQTDQQTERKHPVLRHAPLALIVLVAAIGAFTLRDYLSFDTLRENREALLAFRDSHFAVMVAGFVAIYF